MNEREQLEYTYKVWLLVSALNLAKFAIAELEPHKLHSIQKNRFGILRGAIQNFLTVQQARALKEDRDQLADVNFDVVGVMTEALGLMSQLPVQQYEWYLNECKKLVFTAVNRELAAQNLLPSR